MTFPLVIAITAVTAADDIPWGLTVCHTVYMSSFISFAQWSYKKALLLFHLTERETEAWDVTLCKSADNHMRKAWGSPKQITVNFGLHDFSLVFLALHLTSYLQSVPILLCLELCPMDTCVTWCRPHLSSSSPHHTLLPLGWDKGQGKRNAKGVGSNNMVLLFG